MCHKCKEYSITRLHGGHHKCLHLPLFLKSNGSNIKRMQRKICCYLLKSPGQDLQHLPGRRTGSLHVSSGHSFLMLRQWTRATIRRFFCTWNQNIIMYFHTLQRLKYYHAVTDGFQLNNRKKFERCPLRNRNVRS